MMVSSVVVDKWSVEIVSAVVTNSLVSHTPVTWPRCVAVSNTWTYWPLIAVLTLALDTVRYKQHLTLHSAQLDKLAFSAALPLEASHPGQSFSTSVTNTIMNQISTKSILLLDKKFRLVFRYDFIARFRPSWVNRTVVCSDWAQTSRSLILRSRTRKLKK